MSTKKAATCAGVSLRQLDHWASRGVIEPALCQSLTLDGGRTVRHWRMAQIPLVRALGELSSVGCSLDVMKLVAPGLQRLIAGGISHAYVTPDGDVGPISDLVNGRVTPTGACWRVPLTSP